MDTKLEKAKKMLKKYKQEHLLEFYEEVTDYQKENLINEILTLNFEEILSLYENSKILNDDNYIISPLYHMDKSKLSSKQIKGYSKIGEELIKQNKFAVVTMAGGQGTRLGYKGPKGTYEITFSNQQKMSLFEIVCNNIKMANNLYETIVPWYIMVSKENKEQTIEYFKQNNYFDYPVQYVKFFEQDTIPLIDIEGRIVLQEYYKIKEVSNGNGNVFKAMDKFKIIDELKSKGIEWISFSGIDNVLINNVDPLFLGIIIDSKMQIGSKSIFKESPLDNIAVYCKKDGKPSMLYYDEINLELSEEKDDSGEYLYREANMLSHIMSVEAVERVSKENLPYHRAYKKNPIINDEGMKIVPTSPNTFKFENFIFDAFKFFDDMLLLRVNKEDEFAPIKDFCGIYTPETAKVAYERKYSEYGK